MFCKICQNFMDITNNININEKTQEGGNNELTGSSSDYDVTDVTDGTDGTDVTNPEENLTDEGINEILGGGSHSNSEDNFKNKEISEIIKNPAFAKLTNVQKTMVINKINEQSKNGIGKISKSTDSVVNKECYFYCKTCGYYEKIPEKMFIFSRGDEKKDDIYNLGFTKYKNDPTLPNTKKYTCINDNCGTHKEPKIKMAVFYRKKGSYSTRYICTVCDSFWDTFIEK